MAAFQGWAAGPNFSGAAQNMAQAVQVEEQRKARQSKQLQEVFAGIRDNRRRKEDQAIASATATTAQENKEIDRAVQLYTAQGTRISNLQSRAPKNSDYLNNPLEYQPAVDKHNEAVQRLVDQQNQLAANNPTLQKLLGVSKPVDNAGDANSGGDAKTTDTTKTDENLIRTIVSAGGPADLSGGAETTPTPGYTNEPITTYKNRPPGLLNSALDVSDRAAQDLLSGDAVILQSLWKQFQENRYKDKPQKPSSATLSKQEKTRLLQGYITEWNSLDPASKNAEPKRRYLQRRLSEEYTVGKKGPENPATGNANSSSGSLFENLGL